jgi:CRISPR/Cas system CMR-associated protein Cmr5 small subunit
VGNKRNLGVDLDQSYGSHGAFKDAENSIANWLPEGNILENHHWDGVTM